MDIQNYKIKLTTIDGNGNQEIDTVNLEAGDFGYHRNITLDKLGLYDNKLKGYVTDVLIQYSELKDINNLFK